MPPSAGDVSRFNAQLLELCRTYGYGYLEYQRILELPDGQQDESLFLPDHIHPNAAGYFARGQFWLWLSTVSIFRGDDPSRLLAARLLQFGFGEGAERGQRDPGPVGVRRKGGAPPSQEACRRVE